MIISFRYFTNMVSIVKTCNAFQLFNNCLKPRLSMITSTAQYGKRPNPPPRKRHPEWLPKPTRVLYNEDLDLENKQFLSEVVSDTNGLLYKSPLKTELIQTTVPWSKNSKRTGLIGKKLGVYPMWLKNGTKVLTCLIQIIDNEVVKYIPPEEYSPVVGSRKHPVVKRKNGCLVLGAVNVDPQKLTKEYYGIFNKAGITPKKILMRFVITPNAALQPGTPLCATHFKPGEYIDIRGKTVDRGFQGVMKRWGFHGMPASHGTTKTHRRPGNIGQGGKMARVMPGTKMPGHMGNTWRIIRGIKILRINTKYNIIWVLAQNVPGETNTMCYLYDTIIPTKRNTSPHFPTYLPDEKTGELPENLYADDVHPFDNPSIEFQPES